MGKFIEQEEKMFEKDLNYIKRCTGHDISLIRWKYKSVMAYKDQDWYFVCLLEAKDLISTRKHRPYRLTEKGHKFWYYINSLH